MRMIRHHVPFQYFTLTPPGQFTEYFAKVSPQITIQFLVPVLRYPGQMILTLCAPKNYVQSESESIGHSVLWG